MGRQIYTANPSFTVLSHSQFTSAADDGNMLPPKIIPRDELQEVRLVTSGIGEETSSPNMSLNQFQDTAHKHDPTTLQQTVSISGQLPTSPLTGRQLPPTEDTVCPMHAIASSTAADIAASTDTNNVCIPLTLWHFINAHYAHKTQRVHSLLHRNEFSARLLAATSKDNRLLTTPELNFIQSSISSETMA